jgi:hypothetical protein
MEIPTKQLFTDWSETAGSRQLSLKRGNRPVMPSAEIDHQAACLSLLFLVGVLHLNIHNMAFSRAKVFYAMALSITPTRLAPFEFHLLALAVRSRKPHLARGQGNRYVTGVRMHRRLASGLQVDI